MRRRRHLLLVLLLRSVSEVVLVAVILPHRVGLRVTQIREVLGVEVGPKNVGRKSAREEIAVQNPDDAM